MDEQDLAQYHALQEQYREAYEWNYMNSEFRSELRDKYWGDVIEDYYTVYIEAKDNSYIIEDDDIDDTEIYQKDIDDIKFYIWELKENNVRILNEYIPRLEKIHQNAMDIYEDWVTKVDFYWNMTKSIYEELYEILADDHPLKEEQEEHIEWKNLSLIEKKEWEDYYEELVKSFISQMHSDFTCLHHYDVIPRLEGILEANTRVLEELSKVYPEYTL